MFGNIILDISYFIIQMLLDFALVCFGYHIGKKSLSSKIRWLELEKGSYEKNCSRIRLLGRTTE